MAAPAASAFTFREIYFMRSTLLGLAAALTLAPAVLPDEAKADPVVVGEEHCVVNVAADDALNLRAQPGTGSAVMARLRYGQCGVVATGECRGSWCPVEDGHNAGWVNRRFISMVSPSLYCVTGVEEWDRLNLRAYPSVSSRVLTELDPHQCDIAFLPYAIGNWQKIRLDGWEGWVNRRFLSGQ